MVAFLAYCLQVTLKNIWSGEKAPGLTPRAILEKRLAATPNGRRPLAHHRRPPVYPLPLYPTGQGPKIIDPSIEADLAPTIATLSGRQRRPCSQSTPGL